MNPSRSYCQVSVMTTTMKLGLEGEREMAQVFSGAAWQKDVSMFGWGGWLDCW